MIASTLIGFGIAPGAVWVALGVFVFALTDNIAMLAWALRAVSIGGTGAVGPHWTGRPESLTAPYRALRLLRPEAGRPAQEECA